MVESVQDRMKIARSKMPEQKPEDRVRNFEEVPLGYSPETAMLEAQRCLQCKVPPCVKGCPVEVKIPQFIGLIREGKFIEAARKIKETNALPAVCGRVCPQEEQCESQCVLGKKFTPVAIGNLERFAADYERASGQVSFPAIPAAHPGKVAIVGSGPAGLTAAGDLRALGYEVTVFEALHKAGGVLIYGIPEFRLPKAIVQKEVDYLLGMGVKFQPNFIIGRTRTVGELLESLMLFFSWCRLGLPKSMANRRRESERNSVRK